MAFTEEDYWRELFNQTYIAMGNSYNLFAEIAERPSTKYKPSLSIDGDMWCALYGDNMQNGVAGFGKSPAAALNDFDKNFSLNLD